MTKKEALERVKLRARFNKWLGDGFDAQRKERPTMTRRWVFCWDGEPVGIGDCFDCACCLSDEEHPTCACICHERITQIINFFWKEFNKKGAKK
jgi:hypothetical protein